jgi:predicted site-specific integrase-resolvase
MFGVAVPTLAAWARDGALPFASTPGGHRRYRRGDVQALLTERTSAADLERMAMEEDAVRLYQQGWSVRQVADRFDCGYGAMRRILLRHSALRERR